MEIKINQKEIEKYQKLAKKRGLILHDTDILYLKAYIQSIIVDIKKKHKTNGK
jgi:hypothetical protein